MYNSTDGRGARGSSIGALPKTFRGSGLRAEVYIFICHIFIYLFLDALSLHDARYIKLLRIVGYVILHIM